MRSRNSRLCSILCKLYWESYNENSLTIDRKLRNLAMNMQKEESDATVHNKPHVHRPATSHSAEVDSPGSANTLRRTSFLPQGLQARKSIFVRANDEQAHTSPPPEDIITTVQPHPHPQVHLLLPKTQAHVSLKKDFLPTPLLNESVSPMTMRKEDSNIASASIKDAAALSKRKNPNQIVSYESIIKDTILPYTTFSSFMLSRAVFLLIVYLFRR